VNDIVSAFADILLDFTNTIYNDLLVYFIVYQQLCIVKNAQKNYPKPKVNQKAMMPNTSNGTLQLKWVQF
jgi:phage-related holin